MSNKRKRDRRCDTDGCDARVDIRVSTFDNHGVTHTSRWLCRDHAVEHARAFNGRVWGDRHCRCGCVTDIIDAAGVAKAGEL